MERVRAPRSWPFLPPRSERSEGECRRSVLTETTSTKSERPSVMQLFKIKGGRTHVDSERHLSVSFDLRGPSLLFQLQSVRTPPSIPGPRARVRSPGPPSTPVRVSYSNSNLSPDTRPDATPSSVLTPASSSTQVRVLWSNSSLGQDTYHLPVPPSTPDRGSLAGHTRRVSPP